MLGLEEILNISEPNTPIVLDEECGALRWEVACPSLLR